MIAAGLADPGVGQFARIAIEARHGVVDAIVRTAHFNRNEWAGARLSPDGKACPPQGYRSGDVGICAVGNRYVSSR